MYFYFDGLLLALHTTPKYNEGISSEGNQKDFVADRFCRWFKRTPPIADPPHFFC
jgi:hypothetical protein